MGFAVATVLAIIVTSVLISRSIILLFVNVVFISTEGGVLCMIYIGVCCYPSCIVVSLTEGIFVDGLVISSMDEILTEDKR